MACTNYTLQSFAEICGSIKGGITGLVLDGSVSAKQKLTPNFTEGNYSPVNISSSKTQSEFVAGLVPFNSINKYASGVESAGTFADATNTNYVTTTLTMTFNGIEDVAKFDNLRVAKPVIYYRDGLNKWFVFGYFGTARATSSTLTTGQQMTDATNRVLQFAEDSLYSPVQLDATLSGWLDGLIG